jgi:hypothetical protein
MWRWMMLILAGLALAACGGGSSDEAEIREAVETFVRAFGEGDVETAYSYASEECQSQVELADFEEAYEMFETFFGGDDVEFRVDDIAISELDGDSAMVDTTLTILVDGEELDEDDVEDEPAERVVKEDGRWRFTDCESFAIS